MAIIIATIIKPVQTPALKIPATASQLVNENKHATSVLKNKSLFFILISFIICWFKFFATS